MYPATHLHRAVFEELEPSWLGDAVKFSDDTSRGEDAFEVAEVSEGGCVDGQGLVRGRKCLRLLCPREQVSSLATNSKPRARDERDDTTKPREKGVANRQCAKRHPINGT